MRLIGAIHPPEAIRAILDCLALPSRAPPPAPPVPDPEPWPVDFDASP